jgi:exodeoxyribonuclease VII large subunit
MNDLRTIGVAPAAKPSNLPEYSVGEISQAVKRTLENAFERVRVRGEISGLKRAGSGHVYLCLKDADAVLDAVCWRGTAGRLAVTPEDGLEVVATGRVTSFPGRSKYQLVIDSLEVAGEGALLKLLEERRRRLAAEGLFDADRKRPIPLLPEVIGVVTSPTGAVIRDILHRLADRFPRHVILWPVLVQGDGAAAQIAAAIQGFNALAEDGAVPRPDLLIVARGGGSLEDLWAFNEEIVVRAAAASAIPLISAVGHETDTTLIDFAADLRAPTPTAAAEMAVPVRAELLAQVMEDTRRLVDCTHRMIADRRTRTEDLARGLPSPRRLLEEKAQRLDGWTERLMNARQPFFRARTEQVARHGASLRTPQQQIDRARLQVQHDGVTLQKAMERSLAGRDHALQQTAAMLRPSTLIKLIDYRRLHLDRLAGLLESYSYQRVLARGFALVRDANDQPVTAAAAVEPGSELVLQFKDGEVSTVAASGPGGKPGRAAAAKPRAANGGKDRQGSLL